MAVSDEAVRPPPLRYALREPLALPKIWLGAVRRPLQVEGAGKGEPVLVIPGMFSGDRSTVYLRRSLDASGFSSHASGKQFMRGADLATMALLERRLNDVADRNGKPVILLGWSLGGMFARALAHRYPELVEAVATLGSPFSGDRCANRAWRVYNLVNDHTVHDPPLPDDVSAKPDKLTIAMWSKVDGVIAPDCARGRESERDRAVEMPGTHFELGSSSRCVRIVIETLANRSR